MSHIEIKIEDNLKFEDVAILVDRDSFLQYVKDIRRILELPVIPEKYQAWERHKNHFSFSGYDQFKKWFIKVNSDAGIDVNKTKRLFDWIIQDIKSEKEVFTPVDALRKASICLCNKFKKGYNFIPVVESTIAKNVVEDKDYETAFLSLYAPNSSEKDNTTLSPEEKELYKTPKYHSFALYFGFYTTKTEIDQILHNRLPILKEKYQDIAKLWKWNMLNQNVVTNIKQYRKWYWMNKKGIKNRLGYIKITKLEKLNPEWKNKTWYTVREGIKAYKALIAEI